MKIRGDNLSSMPFIVSRVVPIKAFIFYKV